MLQRLTIILALTLCCCNLKAQQGLHINEVFLGRIVPQKQMVEVKVKGKAVSKYRLSYYHSVRFGADKPQIDTIEGLINKDMAGSEQVSRSKSTLIFSLPKTGKTNRYLCYLKKKVGYSAIITLVYMEGQVESIAELRKLIK